MASRFVFTPYSAEFPSSNFPQPLPSNRRPVLAFDAATDETCYFTTKAPQGLSGALTAVLTYAMASATTGNVVVAVAVEAITDGDALDSDSATSFDTANTSAATAVPATAGYYDEISITLTNADSIAAGDTVRFSFSRDADNASDTATGDLYFVTLELRDSA